MIAALLLSTLVAERPYAGPEAVEVQKPLALGDMAIEVQEPRGPLGPLVWAPDGRSFWVVGGATLYRVLAATGEVIGRMDVPGGGEVEALVVSSSGAYLAATTDGTHVTAWHSASGKVTLHVTRPGWMVDGYVAFSPDGKKVFAAAYNDESDDELVRIEAWDVASGRSLGKRRVREVPVESDSTFEFVPVRLAGHHVYFDDITLLVRPRAIRACDDELPYVIAGELGWYGSAGVRRIDDCKVVRADTSALDWRTAGDLQLSARGERAAYRWHYVDEVTIGVFDLVAGEDAARVEYGDVTRVSGFGAAPDASQVALVLVGSDPDGDRQQFLLVWRPFAAGGAQVLALRVPEY